MRISELTVQDQGVNPPLLLGEPEGALAAEPALVLSLAAEGRLSLSEPAYDEVAQAFVAAGHRAVSFDLPAHGGQVDSFGPGLEGMRDALLAGEDPFARVVAQGRAVIDWCLKRKLATPGRIFVSGVSRGGYCALRLAMADPRVMGVAALAPVTDWRVIREFAPYARRPEVAKLALPWQASVLAGRAIYVTVGNADERVGTDACTLFMLRIFEEEARQGIKRSRVCYMVGDDSDGHGLAAPWRRMGAEFLLHQLDGGPSFQA